MNDTPTLKPCPTKADFTEAFDMTHSLIQEAKPREGYITDHLDAAEGWLDNLEEMLDAHRTRTDAQVAALVEALQALIPKNIGDNQNLPDDFNLPCDISMGEVRQARTALAAFGGRGFEIREKNDD